MDLESKIIERLQELRKWQKGQQEKLLQQQHEQRELLTIEQERMYEALGLKEIISDESILDQMSPSTGKVVHSPVNHPNACRKVTHSPVKLNDSRASDLSSCSSANYDDRPLLQLSIPALHLTSSTSGLSSTSSPRRPQSHNPSSDHGYESEKIVETPRGFTITSNVSVEGVEPLPNENKPLQKCLAIDDVPVPSPKKDFNTLLEERLRESEAAEGSHNDQRNVIKRPFLKRGEGLARFKPNSNPSRSSTRPRSASLSAMGYTQSTKSSGKPKEPQKNKNSHVSRRSAPSIPPVSQQKLNLKAVPPPKKVRSKSLSAAVPSPPKTPRPSEGSTTSDRIKPGDESNPSDLDSSKLETKMFEFLEEKAENSSFCSTSSAVIAFMQQSTPLKLRSIKQKLSTQMVSPSKSKHQGSPVRAIRETVVQKDIVISQWDSGPFPEDNTPPLAFTNSQRDVKKIVGSQETSTKILLYNNNDIERFKEDVESDSSVSTSTGMDSTLEEKPGDYHEDNKETNVSMHVRFAEYNEYKTIGLTDTSMLSTDSQQDNCGGDKLWSEQSASSESSDVEGFPKPQTTHQNYRSNMKYPSKPRLPGSMQPRNLQNYEDSSDHSTDDEHSVLNDSEGTYYDEDNTISELQEAVRRTMESYNEKVKELSILDVTPARAPEVQKDPDEGTIFKSELLKTRLLELEREIDIFRRENTTLTAEREKLREEHRRRMKEVKEKEDNLEKERVRMETALQEEKKRITREKLALESRLKDAREKSIQTKQERQEVQVLKEQLEELRDEMNEKEQRWQAAQARQKSQMRVLQMENAKLKQELEKVQSAKRGTARLKRPGTLSNTKAIHQINKHLDRRRSAPAKKPEHLAEEEEEASIKPRVDKIPSNINSDLVSSNDTGKVIVYEGSQRVIPTEEEIAKRRNLYQDLLKEAASGFKEDVFRKSEDSGNDQGQKENAEVKGSGKEGVDPLIVPRSNYQVGKEGGGTRTSGSPSVLKSTENIESRGSYQQFVHDVLNPRIDSRQLSSDSSSSDHRSTIGEQLSRGIDAQEKGRLETLGRFTGDKGSGNKGLTSRVDHPKFVGPSESELTPRKQHEQPLPKPLDSMTPRADLVTISHLSDMSGQGVSPQGKQQVREVLHPDGYTEYWYPNGNVKKVYPDRNITKMIYYNGDVRETTEEGCIKYFYAATKTWHTTYPDGFEILEFPDGQEERRTTDGVVEVSFPDGSIRLMQPDGVEKWVLPDGTAAETFPNGEKILSLPNGQREVHTKEHKRREYPDGTVKYVYPDGTQETCYSNGRIRVKDKDGNLLRDTHQS
ncbi:centromere protein J [Diachasma alloeum]|uniref:centromere protein J n=1 Tax=Diachasma alloeum TaxID=454923 RepID=UPI0007381219|nr:centromere protein J [Diachasma alloeum]